MTVAIQAWINKVFGKVCSSILFLTCCPCTVLVVTMTIHSTPLYTKKSLPGDDGSVLSSGNESDACTDGDSDGNPDDENAADSDTDVDSETDGDTAAKTDGETDDETAAKNDENIDDETVAGEDDVIDSETDNESDATTSTRGIDAGT